ncbi:MAG TPA: Ivy family c-type lysozyme inhibitor [Bauldia sp.]|nr:Ivy family c-type lysozyme inhibitor [Bauldia sp.]
MTFPRMMAAGLIVLAIAAGPVLADDTYLYDTIRLPAYKAAWNAMLQGEKKLPDWVAKFAKTRDATSAPNKTLIVDGQADLLGWICKSHDCGGNEVFVLFTPDASKAWAMLIVADGAPRYLGNPDATVKAALQKAQATN